MKHSAVYKSRLRDLTEDMALAIVVALRESSIVPDHDSRYVLPLTIATEPYDESPQIVSILVGAIDKIIYARIQDGYPDDWTETLLHDVGAEILVHLLEYIESLKVVQEEGAQR